MTKKKRRKQAARKLPNSHTVQVVTYEITDAPILDRQYRRLPQEVKEAINRLHDLSQRRPREAIPELLEWIAHYPDVPVFSNYLGAAYSLLGQRDKAEAAIEDNYQRNPDYLFARIHYESCFPASFDGCFDRSGNTEPADHGSRDESTHLGLISKRLLSHSPICCLCPVL